MSQRKRTWKRISECSKHLKEDLWELKVFISFMNSISGQASSCLPTQRTSPKTSLARFSAWRYVWINNQHGQLFHGVGGSDLGQLLPAQREMHNSEMHQVQHSQEPGIRKNLANIVFDFFFFQVSLMPPIPVLLIISIVLLLLSFMLCQEGARLLKESEYFAWFLESL